MPVTPIRSVHLNQPSGLRSLENSSSHLLFHEHPLYTLVLDNFNIQFS